MYDLYFASAASAVEVHKLLEETAQGSQGLLALDDYTFVEDLLTGREHGFVINARTREDLSLAGTLLVWLPKDSKSKLSNYIELPGDALAAHMETVAVSPSHRGKALQRRLMAEAEKTLRTIGVTHILATVDPENKWSLNNFEGLGYTTAKEVTRYGGLRRALMMKRL